MTHSIATSFDRAAQHYDHFAVLQRQVADQLFSYVPDVASDGVVLDVGSGTSYAQTLFKRPIIALDASYSMCAFAAKNASQGPVINGDFHHLPFASKTIAHIFSSLSLHWSHDLICALTEITRVLRSGSSFSISLVGAGSLHQLTHIFDSLGAPNRMNQFPEPQYIDSILKSLPLEHYTINTETITYYYDSITQALSSIRDIGANHKLSTPTRYLGKKFFSQANETYYTQFATSDHKLPLTWQIVYISGATR